jgi:hypothetical protein
MSEIKKTAGQILQEHDSMKIDLEDDVREYRRYMEKSTIEMVQETAEKASKQYPYTGKDFYVVYTFINDRVLLHPKRIVFARQSCPTPVFSQSVWKYRNAVGTLEYLWTIPGALKYWEIVHFPQRALSSKEKKQAAQFVLLMESGELLEWVKKENGEKIDAVIKISSQEN